MIPEYFIILSPILSLVGGYYYIKDTIAGRTKPNRVSFLLWAVAPLIGVGVSFSQNAGWELLPVFMAGFVPLTIFIASFRNKNAYWKLGVLDYVCGIFSIIALVLWLYVDEPILALSFAIATDLLAYIPTLVKAYKRPESETASLYILSTIGNIIGLLVIDVWQFVSYGFSMYLIIGNLLCILFIFRRRISSYFRWK